MERKRNIILFIFEGFSDWEPAYATVGIEKSDRFRLQTVGIDKQPVRTMGGLTVVPDLEIKEVNIPETAMLILPGGEAWEEYGEIIKPAKNLVGHCLANDVPVAAICAATTFLGQEGWLDHIAHTSNHPEYIKGMAPEYNGTSKYKIEPAVSEREIITCSGTSPISFAREIFIKLDIYKDKEVKEWFGWFEKFNTETVGLE
jgi:putative intracellular protease/amidase